MKIRKQTVIFASAGLLAIGSIYATGESLGLWRTQSRVIDFAASICSAVLPGSGIAGEEITPGDGWKSSANWKKLARDMSIVEVRQILGDPDRKNGGTIEFWHYPNDGTVTFFIGKVDNWSEPRAPVALNRPD